MVDHLRKRRQPTVSIHGDEHRDPIEPRDPRIEGDPYAEYRETLTRCLNVLSREERAVVQARLEGQRPVKIAESLSISRPQIDKLFAVTIRNFARCLALGLLVGRRRQPRHHV